MCRSETFIVGLFLIKCKSGEGNPHGFSLFQRSEAAPVEESDPPLSAPINIKDEPIDEGYDAALLPQNSIKQIKEELEHQEVCVQSGRLLFMFVAERRLGILRLVASK